MTLEKYLEERTLQHMRPNTLKNDNAVLGDLNKFKPLDKCTADDLKAYIIEFKKRFESKHGRSPQEGNLNQIYTTIKKYYTWIGKPEIVAWVKTKNTFKKLNPNKLLTPAEVQTMLRLSESDRDKCLLAMAYESGARISELLALRTDDVRLHDGECKVRIPENTEGEDISAKTGSRTIVLIESMPYIEKWLSKRDDVRLFDIGYSGAKHVIKNMAASAGIQKRVYWHLLRHTRVTEMAKLGMQETAMKKRFGWVEDSSQIKRYTSLTDDDADNSYREALGLGVKKKDISINPIARRCAKCGKLIDVGEYCQQCNEIQKLTEANTKSALKIADMEEQRKKDQAFNEDMIKAMIEARVKEMLKNNTT